MRIERTIDQVIEQHAFSISRGEETVESVVQQYGGITSELRPALEAAVWLLSAKQNLQPRTNFISATRAGIEHRVGEFPQPDFWQRILQRYSIKRWAFNVAAPILIIAMLVLIMNSVSLAARLSIPGDPLYTTKLVIEDARLLFTLDPAEKTALSVEFSRRRTTEFVELVLDGDYQDLPAAASRFGTDVNASLRSLDELKAQQPSRDQAISSELRETLVNEISMLEILKQTTPPAGQPGIQQAIEVAQTGLLALR